MRILWLKLPLLFILLELTNEPAWWLVLIFITATDLPYLFELPLVTDEVEKGVIAGAWRILVEAYDYVCYLLLAEYRPPLAVELWGRWSIVRWCCWSKSYKFNFFYFWLSYVMGCCCLFNEKVGARWTPAPLPVSPMSKSFTAFSSPTGFPDASYVENICLRFADELLTWAAP